MSSDDRVPAEPGADPFTGASTVDDPVTSRGSRTAIAGLVFAGLFVVGWLLLQKSPRMGASDQQLAEFFADAGRRRATRVAGLYVIPFAAIAFMWFMAALRDRYVGLRRRENTLLATVHLMAGALFVAAIFLVAAVELTLAWMGDTTDGAVDVAAGRAVVALGTALAQMVALRAGAVFIAVSTTRAVRSGFFPRWYGVASFAIALSLLLASTRVSGVVLLMPLWVAASSVLVLLRRRDLDVPTGA